MLPRLSSTDTFGDLDYSDPHAIRRHLAEIHQQIDQLKTLHKLREKRVAELENEFIEVLQLVAEVRSLRDSLRERLEAVQERGPPAPAAEGDPWVGAPAVEGASSASGSIRARSPAQFPSPASPIDATSTTQAPPEVVDTVQPETRPSNGTLKKLARMLALKRIRKSSASESSASPPVHAHASVCVSSLAVARVFA